MILTAMASSFLWADLEPLYFVNYSAKGEVFATAEDGLKRRENTAPLYTDRLFIHVPSGSSRKSG